MSWQPIESAPLERGVLLGYFGPGPENGAMAVSRLFKWHFAPRLLTDPPWPLHSVRPTHWHPLPDPLPEPPQ